MGSNDIELPEGHEPLLPETMHHLSIKDKELYWHLQKLKTEQQLHLTFFQKTIATLVTVAAISSPVIAFMASKDTILGIEKVANIERTVTLTGPVEVEIDDLPITKSFSSHVTVKKSGESSKLELQCKEGSIELDLDNLETGTTISCPVTSIERREAVHNTPAPVVPEGVQEEETP